MILGKRRTENSYTRAIAEVKTDCRNKLAKFLNKRARSIIGEDVTQKIFDALKRGRLEIKNPENFGSVAFQGGDPSLEIYKESRTFQEFFFKTIDHFQEMEASGCCEVRVREFFLVLADAISEKNKILTKDILKSYMFPLISLFSEHVNSCTYELQILDINLINKVEKIVGLDLSNYEFVIGMLFEALEEFRRHLAKTTAPHISIILGVYDDTRTLQESLIADTFSTTIEHVAELTKNIADTSEDTSELRNVLELLYAERGHSDFFMEPILLELKKLKARTIANRLYMYRTAQNSVKRYGTLRSALNYYQVKPIYTNAEVFLNTFREYCCDICIDCRRLTFPWVGVLMGYAKALCTLKAFILKRMENVYDGNTSNLCFKITLNNFDYYTQNAVNTVKEKVRDMESILNRNFMVEVNYSPDISPKEIKVIENPKYIRVISDIHTDVNERDRYRFDFGNDFVINCGDTSGDALTSIQWLEDHIKEGVTVTGNHLGYSSAYPELDGLKNIKEYGTTVHEKNTKNMQDLLLKERLKDTGIHYLSNSLIEYQGMVIMGACLYTDFCLYGEGSKEACMRHAQLYMNDFKLPMIKEDTKYTQTENGWVCEPLSKEDTTIRPFSVHDHSYLFSSSLNYFKENLLKYKERPVIIVTHHAPSPHSIEKKYKGDLLNAAFASDLTNLILSNPNIRLFCHGHIHHPFDYILGETRVVCEPFGYHNENNRKLPSGYGKRIKIEDIKSNESWKTILSNEIKRGRVKVYEN